MSNVAVESGSSNRLRQVRTALKVIVPLLLFAAAPIRGAVAARWLDETKPPTTTRRRWLCYLAALSAACSSKGSGQRPCQSRLTGTRP